MCIKILLLQILLIVYTLAAAAQSAFSSIPNCPGFEKRKDSVFIYDNYIKYADAKSFVCIDGEYGKDKKSIFFSTKRLPTVDAKSFKLLKFGYSLDKKHVYFDYIDRIVPNADPKTFIVFDLSITKDIHSVYYQSPLGTIRTLKYVDAATFQEKNGYYFDARYLYSIEMKIIARRDTFNVEGFIAP